MTTLIAPAYPSQSTLARFRARTALTNRNAGFHYLALSSATYGRPWNAAIAPADHPADRPTLRAYIGQRWLNFEALASVRRQKGN